ncbi:MAG: FKBP-type peptidyl-prolyl cis-trans isomerase [Bacteroidetes bacterium]|nr:FKBP-type peptidyl-prolyl cis-trans isomerase [Bacteroidota bacterium]
MKKITSLAVVVLSVILIAGCQNASFEKTKDGLVYKIYRSKDTTAVREGSVMKVHVIQKINDSVLFDSHQNVPGYIPVGGVQRPYDPSELFTKLRLNDSLVTILMMDTFIKQNPRLLQQFKNGDRYIVTFKVLHVYKQGENYMADQEKDQEAQRIKDEAQAKEDLAGQAKEMEKYFSDKHITAQKTPLGAYVVINEPGTGAQVDSGKFVTVKYTGKHFGTDSVFQASSFTTQIQGPRPSVKGFEDGLKMFKSGGKGTIYIPGALGYGRNPQPGSPFKPNEALTFEVEIEKVDDKQPEPQALVKPQANTKVDSAQRKK